MRAGGAVGGSGHQTQHGSPADPVRADGMRSGDLELAKPHQPGDLQVRRRSLHLAARRSEAGHRAELSRPPEHRHLLTAVAGLEG